MFTFDITVINRAMQWKLVGNSEEEAVTMGNFDRNIFRPLWSDSGKTSWPVLRPHIKDGAVLFLFCSHTSEI